MTFTYTPPAADGTFSSPVSEVRLLISDTVQTAASLSDEEIGYFLAQTVGPGGVKQPKMAAALAADQLADRAEARAGSTVKVGPFEVQRDWTSIAAAMRARADALRGGDATTVKAPIVPTPTSDGTVFAVGMMSPETYSAIS